MKALLPKNIYGIPNRRRGLLAREKRRESAIEDRAWMDFEKAAKKFYGRDTGSEFMRVLRAGEFDAALFWTKMIGVKPFPWQTAFWDDGLMRHVNCVGRGPNSLGKTVGYGLFYFKAGTYRHWSPEYWGVYNMRHLGPLDEHAMKTHEKMDQALRGIAREQAYRARRPDGRMGWLHRPNLLAPFIQATTVGKAKHAAFEFFGGSALLTFTGTAQGAKSSDGSDPYLLGYDEVRHETNLSYVQNTIITPRYLRTPDGRLVILYTNDADGGASIELGELFRRGQLRRHGWYSIALGLDENKTIRQKDKDRVEGDISKRIRGQVLRGEEVQPKGAFYAKRAVDRMFFGEEPQWLDELGENKGERICRCSSCDQKQLSGFAPLRARVEARCLVCRAKRAGEGNALHQHPLVAFIDPASSAEGADGIVFMVADLEPPGFDGMEVVYAERIEEGSAIGDVVAHANAVASQVGEDEVGYDRKGAFGHAFEDESYQVEGNFVGVQNDTFEQKSKRLGFVETLADKKALRVPESTVIRAQMTHYKRKDAKIAQDFVMCLAGLCELAKPYLPDRVFEAEPDTDKREPEGEDVRYAGMGDDEAYSVEDEDALAAAAEVDDE